MIKLLFCVTVLAAATLVQAHPGQSEESLMAELNIRNAYIENLENANLANCVPKLTKRGLDGQDQLQAIAKRRLEKVKALRRGLGLAEDGTRIHYAYQIYEKK
jgi:hypothetical protein